MTFFGPYGNVLENTAALGDRHDDHHARQQAQRVEIDTTDGRFLVENTEHDHQAGTQQRNDCPVDLFRDNYCIGNNKQDRGHPERVPAEDYVRGIYIWTMHFQVMPVPG